MCIMPDTRPRIVFNSNGICNACENAILKKKINWKKRKLEFIQINKKIKKKKKKKDTEVIVWLLGELFPLPFTF